MINPGIKKMIENNALAFATVTSKRKPHCIAVGDVKVIGKNQLLIGDVYFVETNKNIKANKNVSLSVWTRNWEKDCHGYEFRGTAKYFNSGKWLEQVKKVHKGFHPKGAILITLSKIKKLL